MNAVKCVVSCSTVLTEPPKLEIIQDITSIKSGVHTIEQTTSVELADEIMLCEPGSSLLPVWTNRTITFLDVWGFQCYVVSIGGTTSTCRLFNTRICWVQYGTLNIKVYCYTSRCDSCHQRFSPANIKWKQQFFRYNLSWCNQCTHTHTDSYPTTKQIQSAVLDQMLLILSCLLKPLLPMRCQVGKKHLLFTCMAIIFSLMGVMFYHIGTI